MVKQSMVKDSQLTRLMELQRRSGLDKIDRVIDLMETRRKAGISSGEHIWHDDVVLHSADLLSYAMLPCLHNPVMHLLRHTKCSPYSLKLDSAITFGTHE
jgi:hypothetical protein